MARTFVGLDVGHHAVRAVSLRREGRSFAVVAHAEIPRLDDDGTPRPLRAVIKDINKLVPLGRSPVVSLGDLNTLVRYVGTIPLPPDRLQRLLRLELLQAIEASELAADSFEVPLASDEIIHCCVLTQPTHAHEAINDMVAEGVADPILHVAPAAVYNATVPLPPVQDQDMALLVDIGSAYTNVVLFGDRRLLACRQLAIGGDAFTEALAGGDKSATQVAEQRKLAGDGSASPFGGVGRKSIKNLDGSPAVGSSTSDDDDDSLQLDGDKDATTDLTGGLSFEEDGDDDSNNNSAAASADGDKHDLASSAEIPAAEASEREKTTDDASVSSALKNKTATFTLDTMESVTVKEPGFATQQIATRVLGAELTKVAENMYGQLASSLAWFRTQIHARQLNITKVFLTGGGASLDGLEAYLERRFNMPVRRFDPCDGLTGRLPDRPHTFATAIGLAIAGANSINGTICLDLTPDTMQRKRLWRSRLIWPYVAAASLLLATILACWTMAQNQSVAAANLESFALYQKNYDDLKKQLADLQREREGLTEDLRAIAGRIYAGRDLLLTIRALKEQTKDSKELWITSLETVDIGKDSDVTDPALATDTRSNSSRPVIPANKSGGRRDTAIDRGAVDVSGLVKFDVKKSDVELNGFFKKYKAALDAWKPFGDGSTLFRDSRVLQHLIAHEEVKITTVRTTRTTQPEILTEAGRFPFKIRFFYQSTQLDAITSAQAVEGPQQP